MRKVLLVGILLIVGAKAGWDYLSSPKFQAYADRTHKPWTCKVEFWLGEYMVLLSRYDKAAALFTRVADRCAGTEEGERSAFELGDALENGGKRADAIDAYQKFVEKYPTSARARLAEKSADMLKQ